MPDAAGQRDKRLLGEILIEAGLLTRRGLQAALEEQRLRGGRLGYNLLRLGRVTPAELHLFLQAHLEAVSPEILEALRVSPPVDLIPARVAHHYGVFPLAVEEDVLTLAVTAADAPRLVPAVEELTGLRVDPVVCPPARIASALTRFYPAEVETGVVQRAPGDNLLVLVDRERGILPLLPETLREDTPAVDWLRALLSEAIRRGALRLMVERAEETMRVTLRRDGQSPHVLTLPGGAFAGLAGLIETMARLAWRGRVAPREGRFAADASGRRVRVAVVALPGLAGESYELHLRDVRVTGVDRGVIAGETPDLAARVERMAEERRGLLVIAGAEQAEIGAGLAGVAALVGGRLSGVMIGRWPGPAGWESVGAPGLSGAPGLAAIVEDLLKTSRDLLVLPGLTDQESARVARSQAGERVVIAPVEAPDAFGAAELVARRGTFADEAGESLVAGFLGVRLMEELCPGCRRDCDVGDLLALGPRPARRTTGPFAISAGCRECHGGAGPSLRPVFEFLAAAPGERLLRPGTCAAALRADHLRRGMRTLFVAAMDKAAAGVLDVREPLRLLVHEQC